MKTVVLGASPNPDRISYMAVERLKKRGHEVIAIGNKTGEIEGVQIITEHPDLKDVDTLTLYLGPANQAAVQDYILSLHPKRIIFNPGTENPDFENIANQQGIETVNACTLVMLSTNSF